MQRGSLRARRRQQAARQACPPHHWWHYFAPVRRFLLHQCLLHLGLARLGHWNPLQSHLRQGYQQHLQQACPRHRRLGLLR